jgi:hypothetical protein
MSFVAVAIGSAAVIGGGASIIAGNKAASAAGKASDASVGESRRQYDLTREDYAPYREVGTSALRKLGAMYGVSTEAPAGTVDWGKYVTSQPDVAYDYTLHSGEDINSFGQSHYARDGSRRDLTPYTSAGQTGTVDTSWQTSPGYNFRLGEGVKAVERSASARGLLGSGGTMKAIQRYGEGLAASEYDSYANRLAAMAGVGQSATGSTAAAGAQASQGIQQAYQNAGNAKASAYQATGTAVGGIAGNLAGAYLYQKGFKTPTWNAGMPGSAV